MKVPILLPNIFNYPFTYDTDLKLKVGDYVVVPFGKSELTGVVWDDFEKKTNKNFAIKKVLKNKLGIPIANATFIHGVIIKAYNVYQEWIQSLKDRSIYNKNKLKLIINSIFCCLIISYPIPGRSFWPY